MKQFALSIALLVCIGQVAGHVHAQVTFDQRIGELSKQISDGLTENQKQTIAVVEFVDLEGRVTSFGRFVAEELITRLYQTKKFKVIERQLLKKSKWRCRPKPAGRSRPKQTFTVIGISGLLTATE